MDHNRCQWRPERRHRSQIRRAAGHRFNQDVERSETETTATVVDAAAKRTAARKAAIGSQATNGEVTARPTGGLKGALGEVTWLLRDFVGPGASPRGKGAGRCPLLSKKSKQWKVSHWVERDHSCGTMRWPRGASLD